MKNFSRFGVVGAGAWGTALALALLRAGRDVLLWAREGEVVQSITAERENKIFLPDVRLPAELSVTNDLAALAACEALLIVVPVQPMQSVLAQLRGAGIGPSVPLVLCSKGIEKGTLKFPATLAAETLPDHPLAVLSGPSFAREVALDQPAALTLACAEAGLGKELVQAMGSKTLRLYDTDDVIGTQIGGAIKNVLAVATGIAAGSGFGENARAALITRGLAEMMRLALALGARAETLMGLSGLGDLTLTCSSLQSRNMSLGFALGQGKKLEEILGARSSVAEGVPTAAAACALAAQHGVEVPICAAVNAILNEGAGVRETVSALLARPFKAERIDA